MSHNTAHRTLAALFVLAVALAGCTDSSPEEPDAGGDEHTGAGAGQTNQTNDSPATPEGNTTPVPRVLNLAANVTSGEVPLNVTFSLSVEGLTGNETWKLLFGDGGNRSGVAEDLPAEVNYTYQVGGNFSANFTVQFEDGEALTEKLNITVMVPAGAGAPDVVHYEFGEAAGCAGDFIGIVDSAAGLGLNCISFIEGPDADPIDGFWVPLDERYWGMALTSTTDQGAGPGGASGFAGDSDCVFTDADFAVTGEANGSSGSCEGTVPEGTAWLFAYYYATPGVALVIDFV